MSAPQSWGRAAAAGGAAAGCGAGWGAAGARQRLPDRRWVLGPGMEEAVAAVGRPLLSSFGGRC